MLSLLSLDTAPAPLSPAMADTTAWYPTGRQWFDAIVAAIEQAEFSVEMEFYIWTPGRLATRLETALQAAAQRGCRVRLLLDAYGSEAASPSVRRLRAAGMAVTWFNPRRWTRLTFRNHRKLVVVDRARAFIGGCNVADEYDGDGVESGWRDLGIAIHDPTCALALADSFDCMWVMAPFDHVPSASAMPASAKGADWELFFAGAGRGGRRYRRQLHRDLGRATQVDVLAAYFVPTTRLRRLLTQVARRGAVRVIVPAAGDVPVAHHASAHVLDRLIPSRIRVFEYVPAMLHAKLIVADNVVYVGSANFDPRSLRINFDAMLRIDDAGAATQARAIIDQVQRHARPYRAGEPGPLVRAYRRVAYLAMAWLDPLIARRKLRLLA